MKNESLSQQVKFLSSMFSNTRLRKQYLSFVVDNLKIWTGCECAGIRVINEDGTMPYDAFVGFSFEFWAAENMLSIKDNECVCIRVANGRADTEDMGILTQKGSVLANDLQGFSKEIPVERQERYRGKCIECGFGSLAVVPIKHDGAVIGLIHLADKKKNMIGEEKIMLIESVSCAIGEVMVRFQVEDDFKMKTAELRSDLHDLRHGIRDSLRKFDSPDQQKMLFELEDKIEAIEGKWL